MSITKLPPPVRLAVFYEMLRQEQIVQPVPEFRFDLSRKWRFDFAWPGAMLALEVEGGVWSHGRHTRGVGFLKDMEKYNAAAVSGWRLIRCTPPQLATPDLIATLKQAMESQAAPLSD